MNILKIAYLPEISADAKNFIKNNINPSMTSTDESSFQYSLDFVLSALEDYHELYAMDYVYLKNLEVQEIQYIEF